MKIRLNIKCLLVVFLICSSAFPVLSQNEDLESRVGVALKRELSKRFDTQFDFENRMEDNSRQFKSFLLETSLKYKLNDFLKAGAGYRYSIRTLYNEQRFFADIAVKNDLSRFKISNRLRYQTDRRFDILPEDVLRHKLDVSYNVRKTKFEPYVSGELFYSIYYKGNRFDKIRFETGFESKVMKRTYMTFYVMRQWEINVNNPQNATILGFKMSYDMKRKKKNKVE